jgi:serine/threonine-protein kinase HipA
MRKADVFMHNIQAGILIEYFGRSRLGLNLKSVSSIMDELVQVMPAWERLIEVSFLSDQMKKKYRRLLKVRSERLFV